MHYLLVECEYKKMSTNSSLKANSFKSRHSQISSGMHPIKSLKNHWIRGSVGCLYIHNIIVTLISSKLSYSSRSYFRH